MVIEVYLVMTVQILLQHRMHLVHRHFSIKVHLMNMYGYSAKVEQVRQKHQNVKVKHMHMFHSLMVHAIRIKRGTHVKNESKGKRCKIQKVFSVEEEKELVALWSK